MDRTRFSDLANELWGMGFTVVARRPMPADIDPALIPAGVSYQWWHLDHDKARFGPGSGWAPVHYERHPGVFAPYTAVGPVEYRRLGLFEKSKADVDAEHAANAAKARQNVADWIDDAVAAGLSGSFCVDTDDGAPIIPIGQPSYDETLQSDGVASRVKIPPDVMPYLTRIMLTRDRLIGDWYRLHPADGPIPAAEKSKLTQQAIDRVRALTAATKEGVTDGK